MSKSRKKPVMRRIRDGWRSGLVQGDVGVWLGTLLLAGQLYLMFFTDLQQVAAGVLAARDSEPRSVATNEAPVTVEAPRAARTTAPAPAPAPTSGAAAVKASREHEAANGQRSASAPQPVAGRTQEAPVEPAPARADPSPPTTRVAANRPAAAQPSAAPPAAPRTPACTLDQIAGTYDSQYGVVVCAPGNDELSCCYGPGACEKTLQLRLAADGRSLNGVWRYRSGERGPAYFGLTSSCALDHGRWGTGRAADKPWMMGAAR